MARLNTPMRIQRESGPGFLPIKKKLFQSAYGPGAILCPILQVIPHLAPVIMIETKPFGVHTFSSCHDKRERCHTKYLPNAQIVDGR